VAARKVLTRAESQAQTRQDLLDAAELMFHANGYHATSIASIAAEAGRTIGAVYSNFDSKEALCLEVLRRRYMSEVTKLLEGLVGAGDSLDARVEAVSGWWSHLSSETPLTILMAEYATSTLRDADQIAANREMLQRVADSARVLLEDSLPDGVSNDDPSMEKLINAVVSTGAGLAVGQAMGFIDAGQSAELLTATLRMWFEKLADSAIAVNTS
jgi:AcrR family transcriptional regulator